MTLRVKLLNTIRRNIRHFADRAKAYEAQGNHALAAQVRTYERYWRDREKEHLGK